MAAGIEAADPHKLRIVHVFRAPLGGLFRHVVDLAAEQSARGHDVGMFFDSAAPIASASRTRLARMPGGPQARRRDGADPPQSRPLRHRARWRASRAWLRRAQARRRPRPRLEGRRLRALQPRLPDRDGAVRAYTPHGGSFNYRPGSAAAPRLYGGREARWRRSTDVFLFESAYIAGRFDALSSARAHGVRRIVANGIGAAEFAAGDAQRRTPPISSMSANCAPPKASTRCSKRSRCVGRARGAHSARRAGRLGPRRSACSIERAQAARHRAIASPFPARCRCARPSSSAAIMVVPSRAESMPYVVLEGGRRRACR